MEIPKRKRNRLKNYDYSEPGVYFITICSKDRKWLFWDVGASSARPGSTSHFSRIGYTIDEKIHCISQMYRYIKVDNYVIMPNHVHLLLSYFYSNNGRALLAPTPSISHVIQQFKGAVTKSTGISVWQKSFHDRVVRNEKEYRFIYEYITNNPFKWDEDSFYIQS